MLDSWLDCQRDFYKDLCRVYQLCKPVLSRFNPKTLQAYWDQQLFYQASQC